MRKPWTGPAWHEGCKGGVACFARFGTVAVSGKVFFLRTERPIRFVERRGMASGGNMPAVKG